MVFKRGLENKLEGVVSSVFQQPLIILNKTNRSWKNPLVLLHLLKGNDKHPIAEFDGLINFEKQT